MAGSTFQTTLSIFTSSSTTALAARHTFLTFWREVEGIESAAEVERAAEQWLDRRRRRT